MNHPREAYQAGQPAFAIPALFVATDDALVELDGCQCDFVVRRRDGRVMLRQRRGEFAQGRRLAVRDTDRNERLSPRLDIAVPIAESALRAPEPAPGSWQEKLKFGFMAGVTQTIGSMFSFGLQHETAEVLLAEITERWADVTDGDLIEESADAAVTLAHSALRHFVGSFYLGARRLFDPWMNRCLANGSFLPEEPAMRQLAARLDRPIDGALFEREICAYAVQEHLVTVADEARLLHYAARVAEETAPFLNGLIQFCVVSAVSEEAVLREKSMEARVRALREQIGEKLDGPAELGMLPDEATLVGPLFADAGGLLFEALADANLLAAVGNGSAEPEISPEMLLATWFHSVTRALAH